MLFMIINGDKLFSQSCWEQTNGPYGGICNKLKVINTKQFFPELLSIDIETFIDPRRNFRMKKTLKRK